jgi:hypothetical protein
MAPTGQTSAQMPQPLQYFNLTAISSPLTSMAWSGQKIQQLLHIVHFS